MANSRQSDLVVSDIGNLDWSVENRLESLQSVFTYVTQMAIKQIDWYKQKKKTVRFLAKLFRAGTILITTIAALMPMFSDMVKIGGRPLDPVWASIALAIGAALVAADRFFGFSASWMRFIDSEIKIETILQDFQLDWEMQKAALKGELPGDTQIQEQLQKCRTLLNNVNDILTKESEQWQNDFRNTLKQIDKGVAR